MTHNNRGRLSVKLGGDWRLYSATLPAGSVVLGTISRGRFDVGALLQMSGSGLYVQLNIGVIRTLDQRKVAAAIESARLAAPAE